MLQIIANHFSNVDENLLIMPGLGTYYKDFYLKKTNLNCQTMFFKYNNNPSLFNYKFIGLLNKLYFQNLNSIPTNSITSYKQITEILDETKSFQIERVIGSNIFLRGYIINKESLDSFREISPFRCKSLNSFFYKKINNLSSNNSSEEEELLPISSSSSSSSSSVSKTEKELLNISSSSSSSSSLLIPINNNKKIIDFKITGVNRGYITYEFKNNEYIITKFKTLNKTFKLNIKVDNGSNFFLTTQRSSNLLIRFLQKSLIDCQFYIKTLVEVYTSKIIDEKKDLNLSDYNKKEIRAIVLNSNDIKTEKKHVTLIFNDIINLYSHKDNFEFLMYTNLLNVNDDNTLGLSDNINESIILKIKSFVENKQNEKYSKDATKYLNFIKNNNFEEANYLFHIIYRSNNEEFHKMILRKIFLNQYYKNII